MAGRLQAGACPRRHAGEQADRYRHRHTYADRQTYRQTDTDTHACKHRQSDTDTHTTSSIATKTHLRSSAAHCEPSNMQQWCAPPKQGSQQAQRSMSAKPHAVHTSLHRCVSQCKAAGTGQNYCNYHADRKTPQH